MKRRRFFTTFACLLAIFSVLPRATAQQTAQVRQAKQILDATGIKGGLIVHVGCNDGLLTAALRANDSYYVHGLDKNAKNMSNTTNFDISNPSNYFNVGLFSQDGSIFPATVTGIGTPNISVQWAPGSADNAQAVVEYRWGDLVREGELECIMVWINEDNNFEFIFDRYYLDNNWVKIYDMDGNMVWETNFAYGKNRLLMFYRRG